MLQWTIVVVPSGFNLDLRQLVQVESIAMPQLGRQVRIARNHLPRLQACPMNCIQRGIRLLSVHALHLCYHSAVRMADAIGGKDFLIPWWSIVIMLRHSVFLLYKKGATVKTSLGKDRWVPRRASESRCRFRIYLQKFKSLAVLSLLFNRIVLED